MNDQENDQDYLRRCAAALRSNPPPGWLIYDNDPAGTWHYIARNIGHGLLADDSDLSWTYGEMVVKATFGTKHGVPIDAKQWFGWIREARAEVRDGKVKA